MRGTDDGSQIMGVFYTVQNDDELGIGIQLVEAGILMDRGKGHDALMVGLIGGAIQRLARFEADRDACFPAQLDDLLKTKTAGTPGDQDAIDGPLCEERFSDGVNAYQGAGIARGLSDGGPHGRSHCHLTLSGILVEV